MLSFVNLDENALHTKYRRLADEEKSRIYEGSNDPGSKWSFQAGLANKSRNRYSNVIPYEFSRVKLHVNNNSSDYINASHIYIDVHPNQSKKSHEVSHYIASQGPTAHTASHFWHMAYQQTKSDVLFIVMVTPLFEAGHEKCFKYWPNGKLEVSKEEGFSYGLTVNNLQSKIPQIHEDIEVSEFSITPSNDLPTKKCYHFYYKGWADFSAPSSLDPLLKLSHSIKELKQSNSCIQDDPIIVHCSAGVGRTGTFITSDYLFTKLLNDPKFYLTDGQSKVDRNDLITPSTDLGAAYDPIYEIVDQQRKQRLMMVQRFEQYTFLYSCVREYCLDRLSKGN